MALRSHMIVAASCMLVALLASTTSAIPLNLSEEGFREFMCASPDTCVKPTDSFPELRKKVILRLHGWATAMLDDVPSLMKFFVPEHPIAKVLDEHRSPEDFYAYINGLVEKQRTEGQEVKSDDPTKYKPRGTEPYPYYGFMPSTVGMVIPDSNAPVSWTGKCFQKNTAHAITIGNTVEVTVEVAHPAETLCTDVYLFFYTGQTEYGTYFLSGEHKFTYDLTNKTSSERWDLMTNGIRVMDFRDDPVQLLVDLLDTLDLFAEPLIAAGVGEQARVVNKKFLADYAQIQPPMVPRNQSRVNIPESYVESGDFFGIVRLDGLDPMLGWAMGSTTGHTTVALRAPNGTLFVCESTATTSYWVVNGIQCTPFQKWVDNAERASMQVVIAPMSKAYRDKFNETAAWEFFYETEGLNYGYHNLLWGWVDLEQDNYPCLPPDYTRCLTFDSVSLIFHAMDRLSFSTGDLIFREGLARRAGYPNTARPTFADILETWTKQGNEGKKIVTPVEMDSWMYNTTRYGVPTQGRSMVCCVFVCSVWKAGGIYSDIGDEIQCGEQTNWDDYSQDIFDVTRIGANRPQVCIDADPTNPLCQIMGKDTLFLNNFNSRVPYKNMGNACASEAPHYTKSPTC